MTTEIKEIDEFEYVDASCERCKAPFKAFIARNPFEPSRVVYQARYCDPCGAAEQAQRDAEARQAEEKVRHEEKLHRWLEICPLAYRTNTEGGDTDIERLRQTQPALGTILAHPLGPRGLMLLGPTGSGKTRCMYRLLADYHFGKTKVHIEAMSAGQFDREARDAAGTFTLSGWFNRLSSAQVLFIDDIGKGKWTDATTGQFWELVDDRHKNKKPLFFTTNHNGATFATALGLTKDVAEPLLRRLRENCKAIECQAK